MESTLLIIVTVLLVGLFAAIFAIVWLGHRFLRLKEAENQEKTHAREGEVLAPASSGVQPKYSSNKKGADIIKALRSQQGRSIYCVDHPDMIAIGQCAISGELYCEHCLINQKDVKLAKKYLDYYLDGEWVEVKMLPNMEISQDAADRIVKVKNTLWRDQGMAMIVQGHYKINVENDEIEAYTVVMARRADMDYIKKELSFIQ